MGNSVDISLRDKDELRNKQAQEEKEVYQACLAWTFQQEEIKKKEDSEKREKLRKIKEDERFKRDHDMMQIWIKNLEKDVQKTNQGLRKREIESRQRQRIMSSISNRRTREKEEHIKKEKEVMSKNFEIIRKRSLASRENMRNRIRDLEKKKIEDARKFIRRISTAEKKWRNDLEIEKKRIQNIEQKIVQERVVWQKQLLSAQQIPAAEKISPRQLWEIGKRIVKKRKESNETENKTQNAEPLTTDQTTMPGDTTEHGNEDIRIKANKPLKTADKTKSKLKKSLSIVNEEDLPAPDTPQSKIVDDLKLDISKKSKTCTKVKCTNEYPMAIIHTDANPIDTEPTSLNPTEIEYGLMNNKTQTKKPRNVTPSETMHAKNNDTTTNAQNNIVGISDTRNNTTPGQRNERKDMKQKNRRGKIIGGVLATSKVNEDITRKEQKKSSNINIKSRERPKSILKNVQKLEKKSLGYTTGPEKTQEGKIKDEIAIRSNSDKSKELKDGITSDEQLNSSSINTIETEHPKGIFNLGKKSVGSTDNNGKLDGKKEERKLSDRIEKKGNSNKYKDLKDGITFNEHTKSFQLNGKPRENPKSILQSSRNLERKSLGYPNIPEKVDDKTEVRKPKDKISIKGNSDKNKDFGERKQIVTIVDPLLTSSKKLNVEQIEKNMGIKPLGCNKNSLPNSVSSENNKKQKTENKNQGLEEENMSYNRISEQDTDTHVPPTKPFTEHAHKNKSPPTSEKLDFVFSSLSTSGEVNTLEGDKMQEKDDPFKILSRDRKKEEMKTINGKMKIKSESRGSRSGVGLARSIPLITRGYMNTNKSLTHYVKSGEDLKSGDVNEKGKMSKMKKDLQHLYETLERRKTCHSNHVSSGEPSLSLLTDNESKHLGKMTSIPLKPRPKSLVNIPVSLVVLDKKISEVRRQNVRQSAEIQVA